jgi:hypothetical protein
MLDGCWAQELEVRPKGNGQENRAMTFDPDKIVYYNAPWTPQRAPDRERNQQWVQAQDYDALLKLYREFIKMHEGVCEAQGI